MSGELAQPEAPAELVEVDGLPVIHEVKLASSCVHRVGNEGGPPE